MQIFSISRRSFVRLSVGSLVALPLVAEGVFALPHPSKAHAAEGAGSIRIVVVSPRQVGLYVVDQAEGKNTPVPGAHVVLSSRFNGKTLEGDTRDDGIVVFEIEDLAEDEVIDGRYCFNGSIDVTANGCREFHIPLARIQGGLALSVPTRSLESNRPYPSRVAFDEWDVLYTKTGFVRTSENTDEHVLAVELRDLGENATLYLCSDDYKTVHASASLTPKDGTASVDIKRAFLHSGGSDCLPEGSQFGMLVETASHTYSFPLALEVKTGVAEMMTVDPSKDIAPASGNVPSGQSINIPEWATGTTGNVVNIWTPMCPCVPVVDPFGFFYLAWESPRIGYVDDDGTTQPGKWGKHPYPSAASQFDQFVEKMNERKEKAAEAIKDHAVFRKIDFSPKYSAYVQMRAVAQAKWDIQKKCFSGDFMLQGIVHCGAGFSTLFMLGPIPVYIDFMLNLDLVLQLVGIGLSTSDVSDLSKLTFDYTNTGCTFTINIGPVFSAGVGIPGFMSIGVRGMATLTIFEGFTARPEPSLPLPHEIVGLVGFCAVEAQVFLLKWAEKFWDYNKPQLYDGWRDAQLSDAEPGTVEDPGWFLIDGGYSNATSAERLQETRQDRLWTALLEEATPVTNDELKDCYELTLTRTSVALPLYDHAQQARELPSRNDYLDAVLYPWNSNLASSALWDLQVNGEKQPLEGEATLGVQSVDEQKGGVWPKHDEGVIKGIFSDPRTKVVSLSGEHATVSFIFRIASVLVDGRPRTRLVYHQEASGFLQPAVTVDFATGIHDVSRDDLFDYDFDVSISDDETRLCIIILSDKRADDQAAPDSYENMYFTVLDCTVSDTEDPKDWRSFTEPALLVRKTAGKRNVFFCPRIMHHGSYYSNDDAFAVFTWLHRYTTDDSPLQSDAAHVTMGMGCLLSDGVIYPTWEKDFGDLSDTTVYDLSLARGPYRSDGSFDLPFIARGTQGTTCAFANVVMTSEDIYALQIPRVRSVKLNNEPHPLKHRLTPWAGHVGFLASYENRLSHVLVSTDDDLLQIEPLGDFDFEVDSFGTDSTGTFVFFPAGSNFDYNDPEKQDIADNRIMATKIHHGKFCDPYVFSHVKHPMESLSAVRLRNAATAFISTEITDFDKSQATIWYTAVPSVVCPTVLDVSLRTPLVSAGDYAHFFLTIRNDGNMHLTGGRVALLDEDGAKVTEGPIGFSEETRQYSVWNLPNGVEEGETVSIDAVPITKTMLRDGVPFASQTKPVSAATKPAPAIREKAQETLLVGQAGGLTAQNGDAQGGTQDTRRLSSGTMFLSDAEFGHSDFELAPGKTAVYSAALRIPEDWEGERSVSVVMTYASYEGVEDVAADYNPVKMDGMSFAKGAASLTVSNSANAASEANQDAPVTVSSEAEPDPQSTTKPTAKKAKTANTADSMPLGGIAALAVGAASAGMLAYTARRKANESAETEEPL